MKNRMDFPSRREHSAMLLKSSLSLDKIQKKYYWNFYAPCRTMREKEFHLKWQTNPVCIHLHTPSIRLMYIWFMTLSTQHDGKAEKKSFSLPSSLFFAPDVHFCRSCERHKNQHSNRETSSFTRCVCSLRARENRQVFFPPIPSRKKRSVEEKRWHVRRCAAHLQRSSREGDSTNREIQLFSLHREFSATAIE